jgi:xanthosine utilization system XapX-like protein
MPIFAYLGLVKLLIGEKIIRAIPILSQLFALFFVVIQGVII